MRDAALPLLCCPLCRGDLALHAPSRAADGHVMSGALRCAGCAAEFAIRDGVPRLVPPGTVVLQAAAQTAQRFGQQWKTFDHMAEYQEKWLRGWLQPLGPDDLRGKTILEAGCGKGRHTVVVAGWGARSIVALDLSEAVDVAFTHTRHLPSAHVVQGDILHPPLRRAFDVAFSVGVLHHLPDPRAGFDTLLRLVTPGGKIAVWVYGYESNEWIVRYVTPLRERVTARLPAPLLYWLSLPPARLLSLGLRLYRSPRLLQHLPYRDYMQQLATLPPREVHNILFDQ